MHALHTSSTRCGVKMKMHDLLLVDHAATSRSSADPSSPCPKLQSTRYTFGQQTPNSRSSNPTCRALNTSPRPFKPYSYTPARSSPTIATLSHQAQLWPNSSLITFVPTSFRTPQPLRTKPSNGSVIFYSTEMTTLTTKLVLTMVFLLPMACVPHVNSLCHATNSL